MLLDERRNPLEDIAEPRGKILFGRRNATARDVATAPAVGLDYAEPRDPGPGIDAEYAAQGRGVSAQPTASSISAAMSALV
jgi:hypothetical protein